MKKLIQLKNGDEKCPHCGTVFSAPSMHPFDIEVREQFRKRRSRAAKKGWKRRKAFENHPDRDRIKVL
jgi:rRNA maturation protein Nop10